MNKYKLNCKYVEVDRTLAGPTLSCIPLVLVMVKGTMPLLKESFGSRTRPTTLMLHLAKVTQMRIVRAWYSALLAVLLCGLAAPLVSAQPPPSSFKWDTFKNKDGKDVDGPQFTKLESGEYSIAGSGTLDLGSFPTYTVTKCEFNLYEQVPGTSGVYPTTPTQVLKGLVGATVNNQYTLTISAKGVTFAGGVSSSLRS